MNIKRLPDGQLRYCYEVNEDIAFEVSMLCEVGEPYQGDAKRELATLEAKGYTIEYGNWLDSPPWAADFAMENGQSDDSDDETSAEFVPSNETMALYRAVTGRKV